MHLVEIEAQLAHEPKARGAREADGEGLRPPVVAERHQLPQEDLHVVLRDAPAGEDRAQAARGPLGLVDEVPRVDRRVPAIALEDPREHGVVKTPARLGGRDEAGTPAHLDPFQGAGGSKPEEVDEHGDEANASARGGFEARVEIGKDEVVEAEGNAVTVDAQAGASVAEDPPAHGGETRAREPGEHLVDATAHLGLRDTSLGLPGIGPEVPPVAQPGQVDADEERLAAHAWVPQRPSSAER